MRRPRLALLLLGLGVLACARARHPVKQDTAILDCDMLTQELARLHEGMSKDEVVRILGTQSWVISGIFDQNSVHWQTVVYNYNADCLKIRGHLPPQARRRVLIEFANQELHRIVDAPVNQGRS